MHGMSAKKKMAVVERWLLVELRLHRNEHVSNMLDCEQSHIFLCKVTSRITYAREWINNFIHLDL